MTTDTRLTFRCSVLAGTIHGGYAENGMGGAVVCKLNYADYAGERVIEIRDFDEENLHLYYMAWREEKRIIHCSECGQAVLVQGNKTKYCDKCADIVKNEQIKHIMREKRKS